MQIDYTKTKQKSPWIKLILGVMAILLMLGLMPINSFADEGVPNGWAWYKYANTQSNNTVLGDKYAAITNPKEVDTKWARKLGSGWTAAPTPPLISEEYVYAAVGSKVVQYSKKNGQETNLSRENSEEFNYDNKGKPRTVGYAMHPMLYVDGKFFIPISGGGIQCVDAKNLKPLWATKIRDEQNVSNISYAHIDGKLFVYGATWKSETDDGTFFAVNVDDGKLTKETVNVNGKEHVQYIKDCAWEFTPSISDKETQGDDNRPRGFYWAGAYANEKYVVVGTDNGLGDADSVGSSIYVLDSKGGQIISKIVGLSGDIRSSICYHEEKIYFASKSGYIYRCKISNDGKLEKSDKIESLKIGTQITGTPVVTKDRIYIGVGGANQFDLDSGHGVAVIANKPEGMTYVQKVSTPGYPQAAVTVAPATKGGAYVYTTYNKNPGGIYYFYDNGSVIRDEAVKEKGDFYIPEHEQFCISPIHVEKDGTMYYKNDSGYIFAIKKNIAYLDGLDVSDGDQPLFVTGRNQAIKVAFDSLVKDYNCQVISSAKSVNVTPTVSKGSTAKISTMSVTPDTRKPKEKIKKEYGNELITKGETVSVPLAEEGDTEITIRVEHPNTKSGLDTREYTVTLTPKVASSVVSHIGITPKSTTAPWESGSNVKEAIMTPEFNSLAEEFRTTRNESMIATDEMSLWVVKDNPNSKIQIQPVENLDEKSYDKDKESYPLVDTSNKDNLTAYRVDLKRLKKEKDAVLKVKVTAEDGKTTHEYKITIGVEIYAHSISMNKSILNLKKGQTEQLAVTFDPENTTSKNIKWKSYNKRIAEVDYNGMVTAGEVGKTTITATDKKSGKEAKCTVNVTDPAAQEKYSVEFVHPDGKVEKPKDGKIFQTTSLTKGKFVLKKDGKALPKPYFDAMVERREGRNNWNNIWITNDGTFQGFDVRQVEVKAYEDENAAIAEQVATTFTIDNKQSDLESLHAYVNNKEVSVDNPAKLVGSDKGTVVFKGKLKGKDELVDVPYNALRIKSKDKMKGTIQETNGVFDITTKDGNKEAIYTARMDDGSGKPIEFKAVVGEEVKLVDFNIDYPKTFYIENWNALTNDKYLGLIRSDSKFGKMDDYAKKTYQITFTPENASNKNLKWVPNNPEIAEYSSTWGELIIPKKAGKASFTVTSEENPELKQEVVIEFKYKKPLKSAETANKTIKMNSGESKNLKITANPNDATEQRFNWSYEKVDGTGKDAGGLTLTSTTTRNNNDVSHSTSHSIRANEDGTYFVTGTPFDTTGGAKPITFKVVVGDEKKSVVELVNSDNDNVDHHVTKNGDGNYVYTKDESTGLSMRIINTIPERLNSVLLDGKLLVKDTDYTVAKGSIVVNLKKETLDKLDNGKHELTVKTDDGDVKIPFEIKSKQEPVQVDKTKLNEAIKQAEDLIATVKESTDGSDVDPKDKWATEEDIETFQDEIENAKSISESDDPTTTQKVVDETLKQLQTAKASFEQNLKPGTKKAKLADKTKLNEAITSAENAKKGVKVSTDGSDVEKTDKWVKESDVKALDEAIKAAKEVQKKELTKEQQKTVDDAVTALNTAKDNFEKAKKVGTKKEVTPTPNYADLTALNKAIENAKTAIKDVKTSKDGKDIAKANKWVTPEAMKAMTDKIAEAEVLVKTKPTEDMKADVEKMTADLKKLTEEFKPVAGLKDESKPNPDPKPTPNPNNNSGNKPDVKPGENGNGNPSQPGNKGGKGANTGDNSMAVGYGMLAVILTGATYFVVRKRRIFN